MATSTPNQAKAPALLLLGRKRVLTPLRFDSLYPQPLEHTEVVVGRCLDSPLSWAALRILAGPRPTGGPTFPPAIPHPPGRVGATRETRVSQA